MQLGTWVSTGLALAFATIAPACDGKGNSSRLQGAQGAQDAATQLNDLICECLAADTEEPACNEDELAEDLMDAVDYQCFQRVLDQHPNERAKVQCYVDSSYDLVECLETSECPTFAVVGGTTEPTPEDHTSDEDEEEPPEPTTGDRCLEDFERDIVACPELSAEFEDQLEEECFDDVEVEVEGCDSSTDDCD